MQFTWQRCGRPSPRAVLARLVIGGWPMGDALVAVRGRRDDVITDLVHSGVARAPGRGMVRAGRDRSWLISVVTDLMEES